MKTYHPSGLREKVLFYGPLWVSQQEMVWNSPRIAVSMLLTLTGDPAARFLKTRVVGQNDIEDQVCLASSWLKECLGTHSMCQPQSSEPISVPTGVINVGSSDGSRPPFLQDSSGEVDEWVTLSHRWGTVQPLRTTLKTLASHQAALPMETLPRLFQDAIFITRKMKHQYLWIDSLCIIQDSKADWTYEISRMESVFKYCSFMISAEFCHDSTESIFPSSVDLNYLQQACHVTKDGDGGTIAAYSSDVRSTADRTCGVLRSRAWGASGRHALPSYANVDTTPVILGLPENDALRGGTFWRAY
jgi:hypothetical protein